MEGCRRRHGGLAVSSRELGSFSARGLLLVEEHLDGRRKKHGSPRRDSRWGSGGDDYHGSAHDCQSEDGHAVLASEI